MGFYLLRDGRKSYSRPRTVSMILQIFHSMRSPVGVPPGTECAFAQLSQPLIPSPSGNSNFSYYARNVRKREKYAWFARIINPLRK